MYLFEEKQTNRFYVYVFSFFTYTCKKEHIEKHVGLADIFFRATATAYLADRFDISDTNIKDEIVGLFLQ